MKNSIHMLVLALVASACGKVEEKPHYPGPKNYGRSDIGNAQEGSGAGNGEEIAIELPEVPIPGETTNQPAPLTVEPKAEAATTAVPAVEQPEPEAPIEPETQPEEPEVKIDPNLVVASVMYRGIIDTRSVRLLTAEGSALNPWNNSITARLMARYQPKAEMKFFSEQTYGDEATGVSIVRQHGFSGAADLAVALGEESESGTQILERVVGRKDCPAPMVCIQSMLWRPSSGDEKTFCYRDGMSGKITAIPYAPAPNFPMADVKSAAGSYGPYTVEKYAGIVNCQTIRGKRPISKQTIYVRVQVNENPQLQYRVQIKGRLPADFSVKMIIDKSTGVTPMNAQPYVDESTRMQGAAEYFMNSEHKAMVKIVKTIRKSIRFAGPNDWIGSVVRAINYVSPIDGIQADVHVEFCQNMLKTGQPSLCPNPGGE
jgi:hypothetical protein